MGDWERRTEKFSAKNPVMIEGLPGIGNVGKIVVDYLIEKLDAKKVAHLFSYDLPNSVFVTESNGVQLPSIDIYHTTKNGQEFFFVAGDAQPSLERASYTLTQELLDFALEHGAKEVIALGGVGLPQAPTQPQVYITSKDESLRSGFESVNQNVYGVVGPIVGVSGLLAGLAKDMPCAVLLCETFGHPLHLGLKEAKQLLTVLDKRYNFSVDTSDLEEEIENLEKGAKEQKTLKTFKPKHDTNYIG